MTSAEIIASALDFVRERIIENSEKAGQRASGRTYAALKVQNVTYDRGELWGPTYIGVLEDGRKPGSVPADFVEIIKLWAQDKGLTFADPKDFEKFANAVAWTIRRSGTRLYRRGGGLDIFKTAIEEAREKLAADFRTYYATEIADTIRTAWQNS